MSLQLPASTYTPADVCAYIDNLDTAIREGVLTNTLKEVLDRDRSRIVSNLYIFFTKFFKLIAQNTLMKTTKEARHMPDILAELSIPRYLARCEKQKNKPE